jgi:hypothetical protein
MLLIGQIMLSQHYYRHVALNVTFYVTFTCKNIYVLYKQQPVLSCDVT